jgi:MFS family permease
MSTTAASKNGLRKSITSYNDGHNTAQERASKEVGLQKAELSSSQISGRRASHSRLVFGLVIAAVFLDVVDFSIVQVALPTIRSQFLVSLANSQWLIGAYGVTMAGFLLLSGRAGDIYGQKKLFVSGIVLFTLASLAGGLAPSFPLLIAARAVQGIGAAISSVTALAIFIELFPEGKERNRALGIFVAVLSAGFAAGAVAGGILTVSLGWRSVMFVNVPIGAVAAALSQRCISNRGGRLVNGHLDMPGALALTGALMILVYGLTNAGNTGLFTTSATVPIAASLLILAGFVAIERRSKQPLIPLGFLRRGSVLSANVLGLIVGSLVVGLTFVLTIYLQQILGYSAFYAGLGVLPTAIIFFVVGGFGASRIVNRFGVRAVMVASAVLVTLGSLLLTIISVHGSYYDILPGSLLFALGGSIGMPTLNIAAFAGTRPGEEGLASGLISTSLRVGFALGLALLLTIAGATGAGAVGASDPSASIAVSVVIGFRYALIGSATLGVIGILVAMRIKGPPPRMQHAAQETTESSQQQEAVSF